MKMIYQKPMTAIYKIQSLQMMALSTKDEAASTNNGYYDKALSKEDNLWDEWDD